MTRTTPATDGFSLLIKPASADCNLRCAYCFYLEKSKLYPQTVTHRMSETVLEKLVASYMASEQPQYVFAWQGGEPLLMGVDFFRKVTELQRSHGARGCVVGNGVQTNGVLLDDTFARHFGEYRFLLGVSLDGPAEIHDRFRTNAAGAGSHAAVLRGIDCLRRNHVEHNILTLVSSANVTRGKEVFDYLCDNGHLFHQYVPCVEFDRKGNLRPFAITAEQWGDFLCSVFDEWARCEPGTVSVRFFDAILGRLVNGSADLCQMSRNCSRYFVVEHNGDVYPCDFFVEKKYKLGNVAEGSWKKFRKLSTRTFGRRKIMWNPACDQCEYVALCAGDCLKHRMFGQDPNPRTQSRLCEGYKRFFAHSLPAFRKLAESLVEKRGTAARGA